MEHDNRKETELQDEAEPQAGLKTEHHLELPDEPGIQEERELQNELETEEELELLEDLELQDEAEPQAGLKTEHHLELPDKPGIQEERELQNELETEEELELLEDLELQDEAEPQAGLKTEHHLELGDESGIQEERELQNELVTQEELELQENELPPVSVPPVKPSRFSRWRRLTLMSLAGVLMICGILMYFLQPFDPSITSVSTTPSVPSAPPAQALTSGQVPSPPASGDVSAIAAEPAVSGDPLTSGLTESESQGDLVSADAVETPSESPEVAALPAIPDQASEAPSAAEAGVTEPAATVAAAEIPGDSTATNQELSESPSSESAVGEAQPQPENSNADSSTATPEVSSVGAVVEKIQGGIVLIKTFSASGEELGLGSGFVIDSKGLVATNFHVIERASRATATFVDGTEVNFSGICAWDDLADLAILKLDQTPPTLAVLTIAAVDEHKMAEPVVAIGHPQGFKFTTTDGIISGYHLTKELPAGFRAQIAAPEDQQWIQTTAAISSGNSGGPLLNMQSEVIGINTWVAEGENLGFACAAVHLSDIIQRVAESPSDFASLTGVQDKLRTCVLDFSNRYRWFQQDLAQASSPEEAKELMAEKHPATKCLSEIWPIVTGRPRGPATFDALNTAIQLLSLPDLSEAKSEYYSGLAELTVAELSTDRRLGDLLLQMSQSSAPQMLDAMKTIHAGIETREGKAFSTFAIAMMQLRQSEGEPLEDITAESDRQLALTQARKEQVAPRLQELIDSYSDVRYRNQLLADSARERLFELQHLSIGSPIQRIEGVDSEGTTFSTDDYAGKVLVLDFWADWCPHCRVMYPLERKLVEEYSGRPFALLGVCCDDPERLAGLVEKKTVTWRNFVDGSNGRISQDWKVKGFPTLYVVDHRGVIRYNGVRDAELEKAVAMLVAEAEGKAFPDAVAASQPATAESDKLQEKEPASEETQAAASPRPSEEFREYVDLKGRKATLKYLGREGKHYLFEKRDGKKIRVAETMLKDSDKEVLNSITEP